MPLTRMQTFIIIIAVTAGTMFTRFLPFILFPEKKNPPDLITYLGRTLPAAMMGLLIVYCLKGVSVTVAPFGIPELIAIAVIVGLHMWKSNTLLSIGGGTVIYMFLVQFVL